MLKKRLVIFTLVISFFLGLIHISIIHSSATSNLSSFETDSTTKWSHWHPYLHMGTMYTTYRYESSMVRSKYSTIVQGGISMWVGALDCTEGASSAMGVVVTRPGSENLGAITAWEYDSYGHVTSWEMTIYPSTFDAMASDAARRKVVAHELGHAYGLGHVSNSSQIMYTPYSDSMSITSYDRRGMQVMTDIHTHNDLYYRVEYEQGGAQHKARCTTCKAYYLENCPKTTYQLGDTIYIEYNCSLCGNYRTQSYILM